MQVYQYFSAGMGRNGMPFGFCFEHETDDVDALCADLTRDVVLPVTKLISVDDGRGGRLVTGRERVIIGASAVGTIQVSNRRHWEQAEEAA